MPLHVPAQTPVPSTTTHPLPSLASSYPSIPPAQFYGNETYNYIVYLERKLDFYTAHCTMLETENQNLKQKVNEQDNARNKRKRKVVTHAWMLTSDEGLRLAEEQEAEQAAKQQKKTETTQKQLDKEAERRRQRAERDPNEPFKGSLTSKNKGDLQEIAGVLCIPEDGTIKELQTRILAHFNANAHLRNSPLYSGLFCRTRASQLGPSNTSPPLSTNIVNIMNQVPPLGL